ncbi:unnamed protein product [Cercopithifilaria johnstoni]|uniref:Uncharacterized protein n=1 Tax=Cercopithifilaria johnstoni TaxID=2874296 RepID=A0A8J2LUG9_9BILA|nr:unnamed protein product [Cercopithifilaria johnstoni]
MKGDLSGQCGAGVYRGNRYQEGRRPFRFTYFNTFCAMHPNNSASSAIALMLSGQGQSVAVAFLATICPCYFVIHEILYNSTSVYTQS